MSYQIYPVQKTDIQCRDYSVRINSVDCPVDIARVSAAPINRRWPGHQRDKSQTELINFISLETDEPLDFEITIPEKSDKVTVRPLGSVNDIAVDQRTVRFTIPGPGYYSVEPYGRNRAFLIFADAPEKDPRPEGDNVIYFGPGVHDAGVIEMSAGQTLYIDRGALVYASVHAKLADDITITGRGILDNSKNVEKILYEANVENTRAAVLNAERRFTIHLEFCRNVKISGITLRDSLVYNVKPVGCDGVKISDLKLIGNWRYNSDGIDMHNCENVSINNCFIRTYDDCICVKGFDPWMAPEDKKIDGRDHDHFRNVLVKDCVFWNDWGKCMELGVEMRVDTIENVEFTDCRVIHVTGTVLDCTNVDYAAVDGVVYKNITVEFDDRIPKSQYQYNDREQYTDTGDNFAPELIKVSVNWHHEYSDNTHGRGHIRNVRFENVNVLGSQPVRVTVKGFDAEHLAENVEISGIRRFGKPLEARDIVADVNEFTNNVSIK